MYTVDTRFDQTARESCQGITGIYGNSSILRPHPLPITLGVKNLQSCYRLAEKEGDCAEIGMSGAIQTSDFIVLLSTACCVVHIA